MKKLLVILLLIMLAAQAYAVPLPKSTALPKIGVVPSPKPTALPKIGVVASPKPTVKPKIGVVAPPKPTAEPKTDAVPTSKPTEEPVTKPGFNYRAIVADPDGHIGYPDYMVGTVQQFSEINYEFNNFDHFYGMLISVDGELLQAVMIYSGYNEGDDHPVVGDTVWAYGAFGGLEDRTGILGTIKIPWYICKEVRIFPRD